MPERDEARETLARTLRWKIEHLDPSDDWETDWEDLPERRREFFRLCVKALLNEEALVRAALA
jgi:hypothetical protein